MSLTRIGRYEIEKELGRGAMAVVYRAKDPLIGRVVAIKTIRMEQSSGMKQEELRQRLYREAQSAGNLNHPGIVTIYDIGEEGDLAYIAMEYIEGITLEDWLEQHPIPPVEQTLSIIEQVAAGLDFAAVRGITHRDIKPGNILLTSDMKAKIADFGIAKIEMSKLTQTGLVMGTPSYMSPEQAMGKDLDGRSDIFSLGIIFYEMLTGERPFGGTNPTTIIYKILHEDPIPPKSLNVTLHPGLDSIVRKMLAKDPEERYQSCAAFIQDLKNYQTLGQPVKATRAMARTGEPARRSYLLPAAAALIVLVAIVTGTYLYLGSGSSSPSPAEPAAGTAPAQVPPAPQPAVPPPTPTETEEPEEAAESEAPPVPEAEPPKPEYSRVRIQFAGEDYPIAVYDGSRRLSDLSPTSSVLVVAGDHRFRIVSEEIYLDRRLDAVRLKPDQVHSIALPGICSAYIEVPNDAYEGCEILLNGRKLPPPYPAAIQRLAAGSHRVQFRWSGGKYAGLEFSSTVSGEDKRHYLIRGEPESEKVTVQMVR